MLQGRDGKGRETKTGWDRKGELHWAQEACFLRTILIFDKNGRGGISASELCHSCRGEFLWNDMFLDQ